MKKKLRTWAIWTLIAVILQFGIYSALDYKIAQVMNPVAETITTEIEATIPGTGIENVQISYAKDYLAYTQDGVLKVFNLKSQTVVFEKAPEPNSNEHMGVLAYQWLPDRNSLIYLYARPNPEPVTMVLVQPEPDPLPQVEDPTSDEVPVASAPEPYYEKRYNNPQLTDLYTLELPNSDETTQPDDRYNRTIDNYPAGGQIQQMVFSTYTNLMYLVVQDQEKSRLLEIDVMKNVRTISKKGEEINNIAVSDRYGTLFLDSTLNSQKQLQVIQGWERFMIKEDPNYVILGVRSGIVYLGELQGDVLTKVMIADDQSDPSLFQEFKPIWEGSVPYQDQKVIIGLEGEVIVYDDAAASIIKAGKVEQIVLEGEQAIISDDGAELASIWTKENETFVRLQPFKK